MRQWTMKLSQRLQHERTTYSVEVVGTERSDGTWEGRLSFHDGAHEWTTGEETSQPNRRALEYWATGLEQIYLDGALQRAIDAARRGGRS